MSTFQDYYQKYNDNSYVQQLSKDPESDVNYPNKETRSVRSGHYVVSEATPIPDPVLVTYNESLMQELGLTERTMQSDQMLKYLSGHSELKNDSMQPLRINQWVTPYALSIYGQPIIHNCPYKNNTGYGDGRAHSIGEFVINDQRYEFQLKGSGTTPFSRFGDGRAVLRSSIREYLVSEAMHNLGVPTTRALSLIVSGSETVERKWYKMTKDHNGSDDNQTPGNHCGINGTCGTNKCNLNGTCGYDEITEQNPVAMICRVSDSFIRVGHLELFGLRARDKNQGDHGLRIRELELMFKHMVFREYPEFLDQPLEKAVPAVCAEVAISLSIMVAHWMRCGYIQSNFNSDNCLVSGRTIDYGPFGFMEKYDPEKNFWTGGGPHFSFINQIHAAKKNYIAFVNSLRPLLKEDNELDQCINNFDQVSESVMNDMWARKLGIREIDWKQEVEDFFKRMLHLMRFSDFDYTMFWRQLSDCPLLLDNEQKVFDSMTRAFYNEKISDDWKLILTEYIVLLKKEQALSKISFINISQMMKSESPKYIPREWMLVSAYTDSSYQTLKELQELFKNPYEELTEYESKYYKLTPLELVEDKPGYSHMSCSS